MALIDKETIRAEIERLKEEQLTRNSIGVITGSGVFVNATSLLAFLDTLQEQSANEDLEKEIDDYIEGCLGGLEGQEIASCARYFYELGCRHTAVMYDDIEYNRQMAEEAKICKGLEKEIHDYMFRLGESDSSAGTLRDSPSYMRIVEKVAHHFAEWGKNKRK